MKMRVRIQAVETEFALKRQLLHCIKGKGEIMSTEVGGSVLCDGVFILYRIAALHNWKWLKVKAQGQ